MRKFKVCKYLKTNLPTSLPYGELAFATDTGEMFVGQGDKIALKKVNGDELASLKSSKRDKSVKITKDDLDISSDSNKIGLKNLSQEVISAMSGNTSVNPNIGEESVVNEHYAPQSITSDKIHPSLQEVIRGDYSFKEDLVPVYPEDIISVNPNLTIVEDVIGTTGLPTMNVSWGEISSTWQGFKFKQPVDVFEFSFTNGTQRYTQCICLGGDMYTKAIFFHLSDDNPSVSVSNNLGYMLPDGSYHITNKYTIQGHLYMKGNIKAVNNRFKEQIEFYGENIETQNVENFFNLPYEDIRKVLDVETIEIQGFYSHHNIPGNMRIERKINSTHFHSDYLPYGLPLQTNIFDIELNSEKKAPVVTILKDFQLQVHEYCRYINISKDIPILTKFPKAGTYSETNLYTVCYSFINNEIHLYHYRHSIPKNIGAVILFHVYGDKIYGNIVQQSINRFTNSQGKAIINHGGAKISGNAINIKELPNVIFDHNRVGTDQDKPLYDVYFNTVDHTVTLVSRLDRELNLHLQSYEGFRTYLKLPKEVVINVKEHNVASIQDAFICIVDTDTNTIEAVSYNQKPKATRGYVLFSAFKCGVNCNSNFIGDIYINDIKTPNSHILNQIGDDSVTYDTLKAKMDSNVFRRFIPEHEVGKGTKLELKHLSVSPKLTLDMNDNNELSVVDYTISEGCWYPVPTPVGTTEFEFEYTNKGTWVILKGNHHTKCLAIGLQQDCLGRIVVFTPNSVNDPYGFTKVHESKSSEAKYINQPTIGCKVKVVYSKEDNAYYIYTKKDHNTEFKLWYSVDYLEEKRLNINNNFNVLDEVWSDDNIPQCMGICVTSSSGEIQLEYPTLLKDAYFKLDMYAKSDIALEKSNTNTLKDYYSNVKATDLFCRDEIVIGSDKSVYLKVTNDLTNADSSVFSPILLKEGQTEMIFTYLQDANSTNTWVALWGDKQHFVYFGFSVDSIYHGNLGVMNYYGTYTKHYTLSEMPTVKNGDTFKIAYEEGVYNIYKLDLNTNTFVEWFVVDPSLYPLCFKGTDKNKVCLGLIGHVPKFNGVGTNLLITKNWKHKNNLVISPTDSGSLGNHLQTNVFTIDENSEEGYCQIIAHSNVLYIIKNGKEYRVPLTSESVMVKQEVSAMTNAKYLYVDLDTLKLGVSVYDKLSIPKHSTNVVILCTWYSDKVYGTSKELIKKYITSKGTIIEPNAINIPNKSIKASALNCDYLEIINDKKITIDFSKQSGSVEIQINGFQWQTKHICNASNTPTKTVTYTPPGTNSVTNLFTVFYNHTTKDYIVKHYSETLNTTDEVYILFHVYNYRIYGANPHAIAKMLNTNGVSVDLGNSTSSGNKFDVTTHRLLLPPKLFVVKERGLPIYKSSIITHADSLNLLRASITTTQNNIPRHEYFEEDYFIDGSKTGTVRFNIKQDKEHNQFIRHDSSIQAISKNQITNKTPNLILIGDSLTNRTQPKKVKDCLATIGVNATMWGTMNNNGGESGEGREGWEYENYIGRDNTRGNAGSVIALQTNFGKNTSNLNLNPFLKLATEEDKQNHPNWCFRNTGSERELSYEEDTDKTGNFYIFDFRHYLDSNDFPDPDVVTIGLSTNDIWQNGASGVDHSIEALEIMIHQIKSALPNVKIGVLTPAWGSNSTGNSYWQGYTTNWIERKMHLLRTLSLPNVHPVGIWCHMSREHSFPCEGNKAYANEYSLCSHGNMTDYVHYSTEGEWSYANANSQFIANMLV